MCKAIHLIILVLIAGLGFSRIALGEEIQIPSTHILISDCSQNEADKLVEHKLELIRYYSSKNRDSVLILLKQVEEQFAHLDCNTRARYLNLLGAHFWISNNYSNALETFRQVFRIDTAHLEAEVLASTYNNIGTMLSMKGKVDSGYYFLEKSLVIDRALGNDYGIAKTAYDLASINKKQGKYFLALEYLMEAIDIFNRDIPNERQMHTYILLGNVYADLDSTHLMLGAYRRALQLAQQLDSKAGFFSGYNNVAANYAESENADSALFYIDKAFALIKDDPDYKTHAKLVYGNKALAYLTLQQYDSALFYIEQAENVQHKLFKSAEEIQFLLLKGKVNFRVGRLDTARHYLKTALDEAVSAKATHYEGNAYELLAKVDSAAGDLPAYIRYFRKASAIKLEIMNTEHKLRVAELITINEAQKKTKICQDELKLRERIQRLHLLGSLGFLLMGLIVFLFYFKHLKNKKELLEQQLLNKAKEAENTRVLLENTELEKKLHFEEKKKYLIETKMKQQELIFQTLKNVSLQQTNASIREKMGKFIRKFPKKSDRDSFFMTLEELTRMTSYDSLSDFETMFLQMHGDFYEKLLAINPDFTRSELQISALLRLNLPSKEIASLVNLSVSRIDQARHQIRQKLNLDNHQSLSNFLIAL